MIPASYLFKQVYRQNWEEVEPAPAVVERKSRFFDGLAMPIAAAALALFARRHRRDEQRFGSHAHEH